LSDAGELSIRHLPDRRRVLSWILAAATVVAVAGLAGSGWANPGPAGRGTDVGWSVPDLRGRPAAPPPGAVADATPPTRVRIPAIGVDAPLDPLRLDPAGVLEVPPAYARPGWYAQGTLPGEIGPAVIAGHVDSTRGQAVFFRLHELRAGDLVEVARGERWVRFQVVATERYAKNRFPTERVYGPTPDPELRLITCGGSFDRTRRSYVDNVVVYAVAA
jgi:LPXTG-site transpeptidase (sortase) family protein